MFKEQKLHFLISRRHWQFTTHSMHRQKIEHLEDLFHIRWMQKRKKKKKTEKKAVFSPHFWAWPVAQSRDYRCDDAGRFRFVCPPLSSSRLNFSKPTSRLANSDFWNYEVENYRRLHSLIPTFRMCIYHSTEDTNSMKLGLGIENQCRRFFFLLSGWMSVFWLTLNAQHLFSSSTKHECVRLDLCFDSEQITKTRTKQIRVSFAH